LHISKVLWLSYVKPTVYFRDASQDPFYENTFHVKHTTECFLIDDDIDDQEIFQMALEHVDKNIAFMSANDGVEGLRKLTEDRSFVPDYIFLDLNMPKMNGMQCLPEIKKLGHLRDVKIIMYSTYSDESVIETSKLLGAHDFLVKPDKLGLLVNKLSQILEKK
jgi:CheY-like chemotaxis protein